MDSNRMPQHIRNISEHETVAKRMIPGIFYEA